MKLKRASGMYYRGEYHGIPLSILRDAPYCSSCRACVYNSGLRNRYCWLTWEILPMFDCAIGAECPVEWREENG